MRVLVLHDRYTEKFPNGENSVVTWEVQALRDHGLPLRFIETDPKELERPIPITGILHLAGAYSIPARSRVAREIAHFRPDLVHVHNFWPNMTPSVYFACRHAGVPVVQTLHNYRLSCNGDFLARKGHACTLCLGKKFGWPGVVNRCSMDSYAISFVKAASISVHTILNTWNRAVDTFIVTSEAMRSVALRVGIEPSKIFIKPSCAPDPGFRETDRTYFCFAGRLSHEKGIGQLIEAWRHLPGVPLRIAGAGFMEADVRAFAATNPCVQYVGMLPRDSVPDLMRGAIATLLPSTWDEPSPVVLVQSLSVGTPVIASDLGSRKETITHGETGLVFKDRDVPEFVRLVRWAVDHPTECRAMAAAARKRYEEKYSIAANHARLLEIYEQTLGYTPKINPPH